ncbi:hypothetical protein ABFX02_03G119500 [Erythranthe guttata]
MWDWHWWCCLIPITLQKQHTDQSLLLTTHPRNDAVCPSCISFSAVARMLTSWLNRRRSRYLIVILLSPFIIPLFFATCPLICAVEICCLVRRKRRRADADAGGGDGWWGRDGGGGDEVGLLQRYLDDQLSLVAGSVYGCGGDDDENVGGEDGVDVEYFDSTRPLLQ